MAREVTIKLKELHPAQAEIVAQMRRFTVLDCGRRFGKTDLNIEIAVLDLLAGLRVGYFAPTYKTIREVWREFKAILAPVIKHEDNNELRLDLYGGGVLEIWSAARASKENVRGRKYHRVIIDEAAFIPDGLIWWQGTVFPLLTDYQGSALFTCSPKGIGNWFYALYMLGLDPNNPDWISFQYPTSANIYMPPEEIEQARRMLPDLVFRQEYLAEFVADAGGVFRNVMKAATVPMVSGRNPAHEYVIGLDWGRDYDYTALSVVDLTDGCQVYRDHFNLTSWELIYERVKNICIRFHARLVIAESNSIGSQGIEWLQKKGVPVAAFQTSQESKRGIIDGLALAIETGTFPICNDPYQTAELQAYQYEILPSGKFRFNAPSGLHDDTVIALALSYYGLNQLKSRGSYLYG